ncbi:MAG: desulfoferrodoxin family protein [Oligoflexales bacterium]
MDRRHFIRFGSLAAGSFAMWQCADGGKRKGRPGSADEEIARDYYTKEAPGPWAGKEATHVPALTMAPGKLIVRTDHEMTAEHYISRHQLRSETDQILVDRVLKPEDTPESTFSIEKPPGALLYAYSICSKHGIWRQSYTIDSMEEGFLQLQQQRPYTQEEPGPWAGKEKSHVPALVSSTDLGNGIYRVEMKTEHVMEQEHYICRQEIRDKQGTVIAQNTFVGGEDAEAKSVFEIPLSPSGMDLFSTCTLHGIWMSFLSFDTAANVYTLDKPGPAGAPAAHIPSGAPQYDPNALGRYDVVVTNTHDMVAGTHFIYKHQVRSGEGTLIGENQLDPAVNTTASSVFNGSLFKSGIGEFHLYAYCNLHGVWKAVLGFEQANFIYTTTPGPNGGAAANHIPVVTVSADAISVSTPHVMTPEHYIAKHQIRDGKGKLLFEKNFSSSNTEAKSSFAKKDAQGALNAYSFCNMHGIWKASFTA